MSVSSLLPLESSLPGVGLSVEKMPAHWLMARLGKRVLRPGGAQTTRWLLEQLAVSERDDVVELAPGLGATAREVLTHSPRSYAGVERDVAAATFSERSLQSAGFRDARVIQADARAIPLPDGHASVVLGEAVLSMQTPAHKDQIVSEATRLLRPGGAYAIHELAVMPDHIDEELLETIQATLSAAIHVGVRIGTVREWKNVIERHGLVLEASTTAPMKLLEPDRVIQDEGFWGAARFTFNTLRTPGAVKRLLKVRAAFQKHSASLCAVALVARRPVGH